MRSALRELHARTREIYAFAQGGIALLAPVSRPCVATALSLYSQILDEIEDGDFAVFTRRATVGQLRRVQVAAPAFARALGARRPGWERPALPVARAT